MKSRGQKALLDTVILSIDQLTRFVCGLILPRLFLKHFGSEYAGITSSIVQFLSYITILRVGVTGASRLALYKVLAQNDHRRISGIINATQKYINKIAMVLLAYIVVLSVVYPYITNTTIPASEVSLLVLIVGGSYFAQFFFGLTHMVLLSADQRIYIYTAISTVVTILNTVLTAILIKMGCNILMVKLGSAVVFTLNPLVLSAYVRRNYKLDKSIPSEKGFLQNQWDIMWHSIADIVHNSTDLTVLTILTNIKYVSVYTVHYLVVNGLHQILQVFTRSLEAVFGNMFAKGEYDTARRNLELYEFFVACFVSAAFSCALVLIVPFVQQYTAGATDINYTMPAFATVALIAQMVMCIRQPYLTVVCAAGHYKQTRNDALVEAGINIVTSVVLTYIFGIIGVAIGTLIANVFRTLRLAIYMQGNILNRPFRKLLMTMLWVASNVTIVCVISQFICRVIAINSWLTWGMAGVACGGTALIVTLVSAWIFYREQLQEMVVIAKRLLIKVKKR